jgi:hypothetical protein
MSASTKIDNPALAARDEQVPGSGLFVVWFDVNCGVSPASWWWEKPGAQALAPALDLAAAMRAAGWLCKLMPDGQNPRADGRWDNP